MQNKDYLKSIYPTFSLFSTLLFPAGPGSLVCDGGGQAFLPRRCPGLCRLRNLWASRPISLHRYWLPAKGTLAIKTLTCISHYCHLKKLSILLNSSFLTFFVGSYSLLYIPVFPLRVFRIHDILLWIRI